MNNVSLMTNKIEFLTNSLSDPNFIGTSMNGKYIILLLYYTHYLNFLYYFLETGSSLQENITSNSSINEIPNLENDSICNNLTNV